MSEIPLDPISVLQRLAIEVAHEMSSGSTAVIEFTDKLVCELAEINKERQVEVAQKLYRAIMAVNRKGMGEARIHNGIESDRYLAALSPDFKVAVREYGRRLEERRKTATEDKNPRITQSNYPLAPDK